MSRIGKMPIQVPSGVTVKTEDGLVVVSGPSGELKQRIMAGLTVKIEGDQIMVGLSATDKIAAACWGLLRTLIANMIEGVTNGFSKTLELTGTGYRVSLEGSNLKIIIGFSHPVTVQPPLGIKFQVQGTNTIKITGADKQLVGQVAADIRRIRKPEPYKGKGIHYKGEKIRRKAGKAAKAGAAVAA